MISSITLLTAIAALAAKGVNAVAIQAIQQNDNCLQIDGTPAVGSEVILSGCNPENVRSATQTNQQWSISAGNNNAVQLLGTLLCMDAGSDTPDQTLRLAVCNGSPSQTFYLTDDRHIAITGGNQCLKVEDNTAVTTTCGGADQPEQFFNFDLLFDTETATALVSAPTTLPAGATNTGAVIGGGAGASTASGSQGVLSSAASSIASVVNSAAPSTGAGGAAGGIVSRVTSGTGALASTTATGTGVNGGAGGVVSGATGTMTGAMTGAMGTAASGTGANASGANASGAGASGASGAASTTETVTTTGAGGVATTITRIPTQSVASLLNSLASSASSDVAAAISSLVPLNSAVGEINLSRAALVLSAIAVGAAMVI